MKKRWKEENKSPVQAAGTTMMVHPVKSASGAVLGDPVSPLSQRGALGTTKERAGLELGNPKPAVGERGKLVKEREVKKIVAHETREVHHHVKLEENPVMKEVHVILKEEMTEDQETTTGAMIDHLLVRLKEKEVQEIMNAHLKERFKGGHQGKLKELQEMTEMVQGEICVMSAAPEMIGVEKGPLHVTLTGMAGGVMVLLEMDLVMVAGVTGGMTADPAQETAPATIGEVVTGPRLAMVPVAVEVVGVTVVMTGHPGVLQGMIGKGSPHGGEKVVTESLPTRMRVEIAEPLPLAGPHPKGRPHHPPVASKVVNSQRMMAGPQ